MNKYVQMLTISVATAVALSASAGAAVARSGPPGFQMLCLLLPSECVGGGPSEVEASGESMAALKQVNLSVNRSIRPREDGAVDAWTVGARSGDCEDYALTKRHNLIRAGFPASSLRLAHVKLSTGEDHVVLIANTDQGEFVLDNLTGAIKPLSQTSYRIVSIQAANPLHWN